MGEQKVVLERLRFVEVDARSLGLRQVTAVDVVPVVLDERGPALGEQSGEPAGDRRFAAAGSAGDSDERWDHRSTSLAPKGGALHPTRTGQTCVRFTEDAVAT